MDKFLVAKDDKYVSLIWKNGDKATTVFTLIKDRELKLWTGKPNNEVVKGACTNDEFRDVWTLKYDGDCLWLRWDNGVPGVEPSFSKMEIQELLDFKYARIIE